MLETPFGYGSLGASRSLKQALVCYLYDQTIIVSSLAKISGRPPLSNVKATWTPSMLTPAEIRLAALEERGQPFLAVLGRVQKRHRLALGLDTGLETTVLRNIDQQLRASESHRRQLEQLARPLSRDLQRLARRRDFVDQPVMERLLSGKRLAR